ncbi:uroporphyrinogen decarboxylase [Vallitalea longa]|uniref:Uroporphyrinogen decarboxylase n=1 Tax=Vallitalea longa TaxID=2936439 RepID=A0A9W5Y8R7_9FIRM|nr:uroporphyrinogen decarboxylase family protein [Vallitalea longa]GKX29302.1 uroporphyrinogen decarboxylase [Vallitalea longa]
MTSKERGIAPMKNKRLDRFPMWYGGDPRTTQNIVTALGVNNADEALYDVLGIDYKTFRPNYIGEPFQVYEDGSVDTDWGIRRAGLHYGQAITHPLAKADSVKDIINYSFPNIDDYDCKISKEQLLEAEGYSIIGGTWSPFFHDSTELIGMEEFFIKMYTHEKVIDALVEKCFNFYYELTERCFKENPGIIDMFFMGNDFGTQRSLLLSPEMWRKYFKNRIRKIVDLAHSYGAVTAVHSCGAIRKLIPDLIDIGFDAINPIQVNAENMNPKELINEFGDDVTFFGGIDENDILLNKSEKCVREETKRIIDILGSKGKYIVAASHDYLLPEVPARNIIAMFEEAKKYGLGDFKENRK